MKRRPILHIPHASQTIPDEFRETLLLSESEMRVELLRMTDHFTDELFPQALGIPLVFPLSRLIVDVERFEDDAAEPMGAVGMGVCYTRTHDGRPLREPPSAEERASLLDRYYHPHHRALTKLVDQQLERHGKALIIDCHSFPSRRLPYQTAWKGDFPEICIGTDDYHTSTELREAMLIGFAKQGFTVGLNHPFAGALTPLQHYRRDARVTAVMIEIRRDLYMDEETGRKGSDFERVRKVVEVVISACSDGTSGSLFRALR